MACCGRGDALSHVGAIRPTLGHFGQAVLFWRLLINYHWLCETVDGGAQLQPMRGA